jgi:hypothetical protein
MIDSLIKPFVQKTLQLDPTELEKKLSHSETFLHQIARYTRDEEGKKTDPIMRISSLTRSSHPRPDHHCPPRWS